MITVKDLIEKYNVQIDDLDESLLNFPVEIPLKQFLKHKTKIQNGKTIHIFEAIVNEDNPDIIAEYILDHSDKKTMWTYTTHSKKHPDLPGAYNRCIWNPDGTITLEMS